MASSAEQGGAAERFQTDNSVSAKPMPKQQLSKAMEHMRFAVTVDDSYKTFSEEQFSKQRADPVSEFDRKRFNEHPEKWWNVFYKNNKTNFFKNRKWLSQEFPVLGEIGAEDAPAATVLEVGAGAGNSAFPILQNSRNPRLKIHACDFSKKAVELIRAHELYDTEKIQADVWDVASPPESENGGLPPGLTEGSVDVVLLIFIFSALNPRQWDQAVRNVWRLLKPGGQVLFRDYGRGDLAQVRFKKGRWMEENFYVRGEGPGLSGLWDAHGGAEEGFERGHYG